MLFASGVFSLYHKFMSYVLEAVRDRPLGLWLADGASPFKDYSGYNRTGSGTVLPHISLVAGATQSSVITDGSFESPVFVQGYEYQAFSLEAWVYPTASGEQQILGHAGAGDGLLINGSQVSFTTKYLNSGEARATFDLQSIRAVQVIGVHTADKNSLYVDGVLVNEVSISESQKSDTYITTDGTLASSGVAVNGIAIYGSALREEAASRHYRAGRDNIGNATHVMYRGTRIPLSHDIADRFLHATFTDSEDWETGVLQNAVIENDTLLPQIINGVSTPSEWLTSVDLYTGPDAEPIHSVSLFWDGEGAIVETTVDDTWEAVTRGQPVPDIAPGFVPTDKELQIRVRFPGGVVGDESFLDNLTIVGLKSDTSIYLGNEVMFASPASVRNDYEAVELRNNWGTTLTGGSVVITAPEPVKTIEVWVKPTGDFSTNLTADATYSNGGAELALTANQWQVRHYVVAAGVDTITFTGSAQVGQVVLYPEELSAEDIANVYASYVGKPVFEVGDDSVINVTDSAEAVEIYAYDWSIEAAG